MKGRPPSKPVSPASDVPSNQRGIRAKRKKKSRKQKPTQPPAYHHHSHIAPCMSRFLDTPEASEVLEVLLILCRQLVGILVPSGVLLGVDVEALRIARVPDRGDDGAAVASLVDGVPVDAGEEGVGLDLGGAARDVTEAAGAVDGAELADDVLCGVADVRFVGEDDGLLDDPGKGERLGACATGGREVTYCL